MAVAFVSTTRSLIGPTLQHLESTWDTVVAVDGTLTVAVTIATTITVVIPTVIVATVNATVNPTLGATIGTTEIGTTTAGTGTGATGAALLLAAATPPIIEGAGAIQGVRLVAAAPLPVTYTLQKICIQQKSLYSVARDS